MRERQLALSKRELPLAHSKRERPLAPGRAATDPRARHGNGHDQRALSRRGHRRKHSDSASEILAVFSIVDIDITPSKPLLASALTLATDLDRTLCDCLYLALCDCLYLALAIAHRCALVTADRTFFAAVSATPFASHVRWVAVWSARAQLAL